MSTSAPEPIIVSDEPQKIYFPSSRRSQLIHKDSRMSQKAYDYDVCGKMAKSYGCSGHGPAIEVVKRIPQTCHQRFTLCCEPRVHHQRMEKHEEIIDLMMTMKPDDWNGEFPTELSSIVIRKPDVRGDDALAVAQTARDILKKLAQDGEYTSDLGDVQCKNYYVKVAFQGFDGNNAIIKAIYWGPHYTPSAIRSALIEKIRPDADIKVTSEPNRRAEALFSELFHIIVPKDEAAQAELEIAFHGKDMVFYSHFLDPEALAEHGSFPCDDLQGNEPENTLRNNDGCYSEIIPTCLKCGKQADMISENHPMSATPDEISRGKWERILPKRRKR